MVDQKPTTSFVKQTQQEITGRNAPSHDLDLYTEEELSKLPTHHIDATANDIQNNRQLSNLEEESDKDRRERELTDYLKYNPSPS